MEFFVLFGIFISLIMTMVSIVVYFIMPLDCRENNVFFIANLCIEAIFAFTICYMVVNKSAAINPLFKKLPFLVGLVVFNLPIKMRKVTNEKYLYFRCVYHIMYHIIMFVLYMGGLLEKLPITYFKINGILGLGVLLIMAFNCRKYSDEKPGKIKAQMEMYQCNEVDQKNENLVNELKR